MDVVIVGAHGQIARSLAALLTERGDAVRGVIRNPSHAGELEAAGVTPKIVDLEADSAEDDLALALSGADAVVFAAGAGPGSGPERKLTVDYGGAVHTAAAAARAGVHRVVVIGSIGTDDPPEGDDDFSVYLRAKAKADAHVRESGLQHTIVRPVTLTDDEPTGRVRIARHVERGEVTRADVAAVILAVLDDDGSIGRTFEVAGGEERIADAVAALGDQADTLDGPKGS